jgi:hypothetical protein
MTAMRKGTTSSGEYAELVAYQTYRTISAVAWASSSRKHGDAPDKKVSSDLTVHSSSRMSTYATSSCGYYAKYTCEVPQLCTGLRYSGVKTILQYKCR